MSGSRRVPEGPAPDPAVQKLRVRYAKRGRMRFTSTRDFQRALERAVRKAGLPMAFSAGFHPHPKISYANAAPTGAASEAEYVEISLTRAMDPHEVGPRLDRGLPEGLDVIDVADVTAQPGALADRLQASLWAMRFRAADRGPEVLSALPGAVDELMGQDSYVVQRMMKKGLRDLDVRAALLDLTIQPSGGPVAGAEVSPDDVVVLAAVHHTTPTVRPEEIWTALRAVSGQDLPRPLSTRLRQGPVLDSGVAEDLSDAVV
ncbi:TIGR03936 family radical SAM-associated protein [Ornithinimicrobium panacihumi]|uniref:TIGR03936 family radical SAM-associated protein n=1 Tax=Ornithinimicrobium panacihumi TaxID=2008449 RepID=UPI003F8A0844